MKFKILRRHIEHGKQLDCVNCPAALCLHETLKDPDFTIDGDVIHDAKQAKVNIVLPIQVSEWVNDFDCASEITFDNWVHTLTKLMEEDNESLDDSDRAYINVEASNKLLPEIEFEIDLSDYVSPHIASIFHPETGLPLIKHYEAKSDEFEAVLMLRWRAGEISETEWETTYDPKSAHYCKWEILY